MLFGMINSIAIAYDIIDVDISFHIQNPKLDPWQIEYIERMEKNWDTVLMLRRLLFRFFNNPIPLKSVSP